MEWLELKELLAVTTGLSRDALHIYAAIFVQVISALVFRKSLAHPIPWLCALVAILVNEWADLSLLKGPLESWQVDGGVHDFWNTMLLPTVLFLLARFAPRYVTGVSKPPVEINSDETDAPS